MDTGSIYFYLRTTPFDARTCWWNFSQLINYPKFDQMIIAQNDFWAQFLVGSSNFKHTRILLFNVPLRTDAYTWRPYLIVKWRNEVFHSMSHIKSIWQKCLRDDQDRHWSLCLSASYWHKTATRLAITINTFILIFWLNCPK